jgi:hypothetical protein
MTIESRLPRPRTLSCRRLGKRQICALSTGLVCAHPSVNRARERTTVARRNSFNRLTGERTRLGHCKGISPEGERRAPRSTDRPRPLLRLSAGTSRSGRSGADALLIGNEGKLDVVVILQFCVGVGRERGELTVEDSPALRCDDRPQIAQHCHESAGDLR